MTFGARILLLLVPLATALDPPSARAADSQDFAGLVDIGGGRKMYLDCRGTGSPTVVLVAGLRGSAEDWNIAEKPGPIVFPEVAKFTKVCAYDRPGTPVGEKPSRSDPVPQPTSAASGVADLHALLSAAGETGPYVLVAHSYGGLIGRLYASTYPDQIAGLVLVDALSEGLQDAETPEQWAIQRRLIEGDVSEGVAEYPALETIEVDRSFDQLRAAPPLRQMPLIVLSADRGLGAANSVNDCVRRTAGRRAARLWLRHRCRAEKGAGMARHARAECETHHRHKQRPRDPQGAAATRDRRNPPGRRGSPRRKLAAGPLRRGGRQQALDFRV